jgi:hypothetical protein
VVLALLTAGSWALTLYQERRMETPMGVAVPDGTETAMAGMDELASSGMAAADGSGQRRLS